MCFLNELHQMNITEKKCLPFHLCYLLKVSEHMEGMACYDNWLLESATL